MARPINDKFFKGGSETPIKVSAMFPSGSVLDAVIDRQVGSTRFMVSNGINTARCYLVDKDVGDLLQHEMIMPATNSNSDTVNIMKLTAHRAILSDDTGLAWGFDPATSGSLQLETHEDGSNVTDPVVAPGEVPSLGAVGSTGKLLIGSGQNPATGGILSSNGEIEVFFRPGIPNVPADIPLSGSTYTLNTSGTRDWNWAYSYYLADNPTGKSLVDLYDITLVVASTYLNLSLYLAMDSNGLYHFRNTDLSVNIVDNQTNSIKSLLQNIERLSFATYGTSHPHNAAGYPIGSFLFTLTATRKEGDFDPVVVTATVNVS